MRRERPPWTTERSSPDPRLAFATCTSVGSCFIGAWCSVSPSAFEIVTWRSSEHSASLFSDVHPPDVTFFTCFPCTCTFFIVFLL